MPGLQTRIVEDRGAVMLSAGSDALRDMQPEAWIEQSCQRAGRNLTQNEWNQFLTWKAAHNPDHKTCPQW